VKKLKTISITAKDGKVYRVAVTTVSADKLISLHMLWLRSERHLAVVEYVVSVGLAKMKLKLNCLRNNLLVLTKLHEGDS